MDVADPGPAGAIAEEVPRTTSSGWSRVLVLVPPLLLAALIAALVWLVLQIHSYDDRSSARKAALRAAQTEATNLMTISYRTANSDLDRIINGATGQFRTQFESQKKQFPDVLAKAKSVAVGQIITAGLVSMHGSTARVVIAIDQTVSNAQTTAAHQSEQLKHYRIVMTLKHIHGRWLASDVAFAGTPQ